ncbi:hypothetical protein C477_07438 [Haloterrigena salina JCM 13891]|uniref:Holin n=1 Tax=Haloterrigena salina JCM 13891 TaxID=1227488 RepID=M0CAY0_9EURY|nr:hypothetical protein [Haloterrigena salina]ELZ19793.1 hypothetical protein C477_07438 [Haloterrigena salina JCM 13891]
MAEIDRDFVIVWILFPIALGTISWGLSGLSAREAAKVITGVVIGSFVTKIALTRYRQQRSTEDDYD